jgi:hypothetical protein
MREEQIIIIIIIIIIKESVVSKFISLIFRMEISFFVLHDRLFDYSDIS